MWSEIKEVMNPLFPESLSLGESVFAKGLLKCGLQYEVVGLPGHHYALLIEGVRVWHVGGHVSVSDAERVAAGWDDHKLVMVRKLNDVLAESIGRAYISRNEAQERLDYLSGLQTNLKKQA